MRDIMRLVVNGNAVQVAIPKKVRASLGWTPGQRVVVERMEGQAVMIREATVADMRGASQLPHRADQGAEVVE